MSLLVAFPFSHLHFLDVACPQCYPLYHLPLKIIILKLSSSVVLTIFTKWVNPQMASFILPSDSRSSYITERISLLRWSPPVASKKNAPNKLLFLFLTNKFSFPNILVLLPMEPQISSEPLQTFFTSPPAFIFPSYTKSHLSVMFSWICL